jgi:hypothetical protein
MKDVWEELIEEEEAEAAKKQLSPLYRKRSVSAVGCLVAVRRTYSTPSMRPASPCNPGQRTILRFSIVAIATSRLS